MIGLSNTSIASPSFSSGLISTVPLNTVNTSGYNGTISSMPIGGGFGSLGGLGGFGGLMALGAMMGPLMMLINAMARNKQNKKAQAKAAAEKAQKNKKNQNQNSQKPPQSSFLDKHAKPPLINGVSFPEQDYKYNPEIEYGVEQ